VARRHKTSRVIVVALVGLIAAPVGAGAFAGHGGRSGSASSRVRLFVHWTGRPPTQQHGGLPGSPGGDPAPDGSAGPAPTRRGTFVLTGAVRDHGVAVLRLPPLGSGSQESTLGLHSARGALRVATSGRGTATSGAGDGRWRVIGGSGAYAGAGGSGTQTQTPEQSVLVGRLTVRVR
jgi:hypothetical protein